MAFGEGTSAYETFRLDRLDRLTNPDEYAQFMPLLSDDNLLSGRALDLLKQSRAEDRDITDSLYQDYKTLRLKLIGAVQTADPANSGRRSSRDSLKRTGWRQVVLIQ